MSDFRRFVIGVVNILLILVIIAATVVGATSGGGMMASVSDFLGVRGEQAKLVGTLAGGIAGFLAAAVPAVVIFALTEIAKNTRQTLIEVRRSNMYPNHVSHRDNPL